MDYFYEMFLRETYLAGLLACIRELSLSRVFLEERSKSAIMPVGYFPEASALADNFGFHLDPLRNFE